MTELTEYFTNENLTKAAYDFSKILSFKQTRVNGPLVLVSMKSFKTYFRDIFSFRAWLIRTPI